MIEIKSLEEGLEKPMAVKSFTHLQAFGRENGDFAVGLLIAARPRRIFSVASGGRLLGLLCYEKIRNIIFARGFFFFVDSQRHF